MTPSDQVEPRRQIAALAVAAVLPLAIAFVCSCLLNGNPLVKPAYAIAKTIQLGFPLVWVAFVERRAIRFGPPSLAALAPAVVSGLALALLTLTIYGLGFRAALLASDVPAILRTKFGGYGIVSQPAFAMFAAYHVLLNAFAEELYWRWFFFARLRTLTSSATAIALASVAFTMHHVFAAWWNGGGLMALGAVAVVLVASGAVWARLLERGGTIYAPWISHMLAEVGLLTIAYDLWRA